MKPNRILEVERARRYRASGVSHEAEHRRSGGAAVDACLPRLDTVHEGCSIEEWLERLDRDGFGDLLSRHTFARSLRNSARLAATMFGCGDALAAILRYGSDIVSLVLERATDAVQTRHVCLVLAAFADRCEAALVESALGGRWTAAAALCGISDPARAARALRRVLARSADVETREWARVCLRVVATSGNRPDVGAAAGFGEPRTASRIDAFG